MIGTLGISGVGLIGGSIGLAVKARGLADRVIGIGRSSSRLATALQLGAIDEYSTDFLEASSRCDMLYLAAPVRIIIDQIQRLRFLHGKRLIVTDGGSTKRDILRAAEDLPDGICFVGGHPMAGSEATGVEAARADLFDGATYVITPAPGTDPEALKAVRFIAEGVGSTVLEFDCEHHDRLVASTSHLPHIVAGAVLRVAERCGKDAASVTAGSFRDVTRVASSDPALWTDICLTNSDMLIETLDLMIGELESARALLAGSADIEGLSSWFCRGRELREELLRKRGDA